MRKLIFALVSLATTLLRAQTPNPDNTVVRLAVFTGGAHFGNIDIELFDQQKPQTVRNFLLYVYSGAYSNILLHLLQPQSFLQAGHVQINDPSGANSFDTFERTPSFGTIASEYSRGPQLPNDFGTIAAVPGNTFGFSAGSLDWILNLANNHGFNTTNRHVVFGRVVNTEGEHGGTNLLNYFRTFTYFNNIRGVSLFDAEETFAVPVTEYHGERFPLTREMFLVVASVLHAGVAHDASPPTVQIEEPAGDATMDSPGPIEFRGTAADNQRVARVLYDYGLPYRRFAAEGTEDWSARIPLSPRANTVFVRSVDDFGNLSEPVVRQVYYPYVPVHLQRIGQGKVIGLTNGQPVRLDQVNRYEARPAAGSYFLGWGGDIFSTSRMIEFAITEFTNELGFVDYPTNIGVFFSRTFLGLSNGVYNGLFFPGTNGPPLSSGFISLNLSRSGDYVGRLAPVGASYPFRGKFDETGTDVIMPVRGLDTLALQLFANETIFGSYSDGHSLASVGLGRVQKFSRAHPTPLAGKYSFLISPTASPLRAGHGFGTVTIDALGKIKMAGTLADGTPIRQNTSLLIGGVWPFFSSANGGQEAVLGFASFATNHVFTSSLGWFAPDFPNNTSQTVDLQGSPYTPSSQARLFNWTNGRITFSGDGLAAPVSADVVLNDNGTFTFPSNPNNIQLSVAAATGLITGSFHHPNGGALTPLRGAVLQSGNIAAGFFGTGANAGGFVIRAQ